MQAIQRDWKQQLSLGFVILASLAAIGWLQWPQLHQLQTQSQTISAEEIRQQTAAEQTRLSLLKNVPTFGFDNLIADSTFLSFLQYFGDEAARKKTDYSLSPDYFEVILKRDPYFIPVYTFLSTSTAIYAGQADRSSEIMKSSLTQIDPKAAPNAYFAWRQLGIDQLLFLGDTTAARQSFLTAAQWAAQSSSPDGRSAALQSQQTAAFLANNPNSKTAQVAAWVMVLSYAPDDRTRQLAVQRIQSLGGNITQKPDGTFSVQPPAKD